MEKLKDISIDYAIMEKAKNLVAVPIIPSGQILVAGMQSGWSLRDAVGTVKSKNAFIDCSNAAKFKKVKPANCWFGA